MWGPCPCWLDPRPCTCTQGAEKSPLTVSVHCNCGDVAVLCTLNHQTTVVAHTGHENNVVQARIRRAATVGSRLSSHRLHPKSCWTCTTETSNTLSVNELQLRKFHGLARSAQIGIDHHVKQLGNPCCPTRSLDHGKPPLRLDRDVEEHNRDIDHQEYGNFGVSPGPRGSASAPQ